MGEPLLYKHFAEFARLVQSSGLKINLTTNGVTNLISACLQPRQQPASSRTSHGASLSIKNRALSGRLSSHAAGCHSARDVPAIRWIGKEQCG